MALSSSFSCQSSSSFYTQENMHDYFPMTFLFKSKVHNCLPPHLRPLSLHPHPTPPPPLFSLCQSQTAGEKKTNVRGQESNRRSRLSLFPPNILDFLLAAASCQVVHGDSQEDVEQDV